jgi:hypothetical protein
MDTPPLPSQKNGLSGMAWLGIGCGGATVVGIIGAALLWCFAAPKLREITAEAAKDPTRAQAYGTVKLSMGLIEMVAADEPNKRYTLREKDNGKITTIYWDAKQHRPVTVEGDFSAIPADANPPDVPSELAPK